MTFPGVVTRLDVLKPEECSYVIETCKPFVEPSTIETPDSSASVIEAVSYTHLTLPTICSV